jgi:ankyrin repeat protein
VFAARIEWAMAARAGNCCAAFGSWWSMSAPCRNTALHLASRSGHTESVKALLEKGADVNAKNKDRCAFFLVACVAWAMAARAGKGCAAFGSWSSVSAPCRHTALHLASLNGHTESVRALLEKGADVTAENKDRCAFFLVACVDWTKAARAGKGCAAV